MLEKMTILSAENFNEWNDNLFRAEVILAREKGRVDPACGSVSFIYPDEVELPVK